MATRDPFCLTPIITAANANILASEALNGTYPSWKAFNGEFPTNGTSYIPSTKDFYIGWNFGVPTKVNYINIYYDHTGSSLPLTFVVEGSNDNTNWEIIKSFAVSGLVGCTLYSYSLDNVYTYKQYRYRVLTYTAGTYAYFGELEICFNPNIGSHTWDTLKKGTNVTITENNANNLIASYTQAAGSWIRGDSLVASQKCFWALEVVEIAADANVLVGAVSAGRELSDFVTNEPGMVSIPAGTLSVGSIIFIKVNQNEKRVYVYVDNVLLGSCQYTSTGYLVPALGDLTATTQCKFTAYFGAAAIPGVSSMFGNPAYWQHYLAYSAYAASSWVLALSSKEFDLDVYLTQFEFVVWWDPTTWGRDTNSGRETAQALKTWAQCLIMIVDGVNTAVVMAEGSSFTGAVTTTGLIPIAAAKKITVVGQFSYPDRVPSIVSTNYATIVNASPYTKFVRLRILSQGAATTTVMGTSAILAGVTGSGAAITFENCYLSPQGACGFLWMVTAGNQVVLKNCTIEYAGKAYAQEVFRALTTTTVTMTNCAFIGTFTHRGTASYMAVANMVSGVYSANTALPGHTLDANCVQDTSLLFEPGLATLHTNILTSWLSTGAGINLDGSTAHRGVYGGNAPWVFLPLDIEGGFQNKDRAELSLSLRGTGNKIWNNDLSADHSNLIVTFTSHTGSNVRVTASKPDVE